jgi:hypothetical protein
LALPLFWASLSCSVKFDHFHSVYLLVLFSMVFLSRNISRGQNFFQYLSGYWACDFQYRNWKSGIAGISGYREFEALKGEISSGIRGFRKWQL